MMPWCQYVIVDWQTPRLAAGCRASIREHEPDARTTLVDAHARGYSYSAAVHRGVRLGARVGELTPIICALNADTAMLGPQDDIRAIFDEHPEIAIIGPRQVDSQGLIRHAGIFGTNEAPAHRLWAQPLAEHDAETSERIRDAVTIAGSVFYCRRSVWDDLGGFLDTPHFFEETWLAYLARHRGYRVVYTGPTTWLHEFNQSPVTEPWRAARMVESQVIFRAACAREGIACN